MDSQPPSRPGTYWLVDQPGHRQRIPVIEDQGVLCARFEDEDGYELIPVADIAGTWSPAP